MTSPASPPVFLAGLPRRSAARWLAASAIALTGLVNCAWQTSASSDGTAPSDGATNNTCFAGAPCLGGFCSEDGFCQAESTTLSAVLLEVTPPAGTPVIAGVSFLQEVQTLPSSGRLDVGLGYISNVEVVVSGAAIPEEQCVPAMTELVAGTASDGSMAARVTLIPRQTLLGMPSPTYSREIAPGQASSYSVKVLAPPGRYDVHVEPLGVDGDCVRSPYLAVDQELAVGEVDLNLQLPVPAKLDLTVAFPGFLDLLSEWQVDIVHRETNKVLSNRVILKDPSFSDEHLEYHAALAFTPAEGGGSAPAAELVRLSPPASAVLPTIYLERSVIELFGAGAGVIDQLTALPSPVTYTGRVNQRSSATPAPGTVTLVATELSSLDSGLVATFSRTVQTDEEGVFEVDLLPGKYRVLLEPDAVELAQTTTELTVSGEAGSQAGKVLEVGERASIAGTLVTVSGAPVLGVPIEAYPPAAFTSVPAAGAQGGLPFVPRAELPPIEASSKPAKTGTFSLLADPGTFHLIARPEASTGFAWALALGLEVQNQDIGLPDIVLAPPFVLEGTIDSSDVGLVPGALVRAFAYVSGDAFAESVEDATSVVVVGEARVDADSRYRLFLPASSP